MNYQEILSAGCLTSAQTPSSRKPEIRIEFVPDGQRARKVVSRSNAKATGKYPSLKMGRMVQYESIHEKNAFMLLDACHEVLSYGEQPCRIDYVMDGVQRKHYPDIKVQLPWGIELWEVKTESDAKISEVFERTTFMQSALPHLGFNYRLVTANILAHNPRLDNIKKLLRYGRKAIAPTSRERIRTAFIESSFICWGHFAETNASMLRRDICRLILEGFLQVDLNKALDDDTQIRLAAARQGEA